MGVQEAEALEIPADEGSPPARVPPRIRRRLLRRAGEGGGKASTAEEIEAKLREADLRRQQFQETLSSKARRTFRNAQSQKEVPPEHLEAKFLASEQNRCWRQFITSKKTTVALAKAFEALGINQYSVVSMPFEELARCIESPTVLHTIKEFLHWLERCFYLTEPSSSSKPETTNHLIERLGSPQKTAGNSDISNLPRYSPKVLLCAYMILGHPKYILSKQGEREEQLMESAASFVTEFEKLVKTVLDGPDDACISSHSMLDVGSPGSSNYQESLSVVADGKKFRSQLIAFDKAWCAYDYHFVTWKGNDAKSLEEDLITIACKLELSMMQTCKVTFKGQPNNLNGDFDPVQKQVIADQKLLRETIQSLRGEAGLERMEYALSETRSKFFGAKEIERSMATLASSAVTSSSGESSLCENWENSNLDSEKMSLVVESSPSESSKGIKAVSTTLSSAMTEKMPTENEQIVNEILHDIHGSLADNSDNVDSIEGDFKAKIKETMERAYWDVVADSLRGDMLDYSHVLNLVKEVRETLLELAPTGCKNEISDNINHENLSQVLESGPQIRQYLGQILQYSLGMLRKLSSPAKEDEMKKNHDKLLRELIEDPESNYRDPDSFIISVIKGLQFTMGELKDLKAEVSRARIRLVEPIIKGSGGVQYLQKAFADRYGSPSDAVATIPSTAQWLSSLKGLVEEEWNEHVSSVSVLKATNHVQPLVPTLRTGRGVPDQTQSMRPAEAHSVGLPECTGEGLAMVLRIGLLHLISSMEGMTGHSVPETFKLNWLRLPSVQSNFQQMIVIATSMLVLHQVLLSENPKFAPSELENTTMELFNTLTKLLDNFSDVGTEHIIEVMMHSSTTTCTSSKEAIENRKQILNRVFLKSLQPDDTVFKKVSRSVYCAFRAVTLGGSGAKGRKLADAALRRIGAIKLTDRVVKAAEVLIKAAMISEQVHGPWYKQLM